MPDCHELKECVSDVQGVSLIIWQVLVIRGNTDEFRFYVGGSLGSAQKTAAQRKRSDERIQTVQALIIFRRCWSWQSSQTLTVPLEHTSARARSIDQLNFFLRLKARRTKKQEVTSARALGVVGALTPGHKPHARLRTLLISCSEDLSGTEGVRAPERGSKKKNFRETHAAVGHTLTVHQPPPPARAAPVSLYRCVRVGARAASERVTDGVRAAGTAGPYQADRVGVASEDEEVQREEVLV